MTREPLRTILLSCTLVTYFAACDDAKNTAAPAPASGASGTGTVEPGAGTSAAPAASGAGGTAVATAGAAAGGRPGNSGNSGASGTGASPMTGGDPSGAAGAAATAGTGATKPRVPPPPGSVSKPGEYKGYSEKIYSGYDLSSVYVEMRDGVKLAVDLYRPKQRGGGVTEERLPVLWMHSPYNRRTFSSSAGSGPAGLYYPGAAAKLVDYGYVVAVVDYRGLYASYGKNAGFNRGEWVDEARMDAYDVTEWFAKQPWSNGKIGMWGCSATGGSQMQALTVAPPSLKAVFPMSCEFDVYPFGVPGGMSAGSGDTKRPPGGGSAALRDATAAPVDGDTGSQLRAAQAEHAGNIENPGYVPFRDSIATNIPEMWWIKSSPHTYLDAINASGTAVYVAANWDEAATKYGAFFTVNNLKTPTKLIVGPGEHCAWFSVADQHGFDITVEELRFFDYWLKGIENGVMEEDKVYYYTYNAPAGQEWRSAPAWPLPNEKRVPYYFGRNTLVTTMPTEASGKTDAQVDYNVGSGATSTTAPSNPPNGIAFTSEPLASDVRVTGHPLVELWVASTATDGDFIATLQDVSPTGAITSYNMHGRLRASQRKEEPAPYNTNGLPYHPFRQADAMPLVPGEPALLRFDLLPISIVFKAGHRIQVKLSFADTPTPRVTPAPTVSIYHDAMHPSSITLPVIQE